MTDEIIKVGEKIHIVTRRNFKEDIRRHFAGTVIVTNNCAVRVEGYTFVASFVGNEVRRLKGKRTRIFNLDDGAHIVNIIPQDVDIEKLTYQTKITALVVTDGEKFSLEVNEHL